MKLPTRIDKFDGNWGCYSNFWPVIVKLDGIEYPSVEHAFQAAKTLDPKYRVGFQNSSVSPGDAKKMGRKLKIRPDWEEVKVSVMRDLLVQKFSYSILKRKLMSSFTAELIEGNWWHDTFWGVCQGNCRQGSHEPFGENWLGKLLMEIRGEFIK